MNIVTLSPDRMDMTVVNGDRTITLHSAREHGFTGEDVKKATFYDITMGSSIQDGEVRRAWLRRIFGHPVTFHVHTGPPTWWWPKVVITKNEAMTGWLRALVAVKWRRS